MKNANYILNLYLKEVAKEFKTEFKGMYRIISARVNPDHAYIPDKRDRYEPIFMSVYNTKAGSNNNLIVSVLTGITNLDTNPNSKYYLSKEEVYDLTKDMANFIIDSIESKVIIDDYNEKISPDKFITDDVGWKFYIDGFRIINFSIKVQDLLD